MKASKFRLPLYSGLLISTAMLAAGCSFFSTKQDQAEADQRGFHAIASPDGSMLPLPIEIADDITKIAQGGQVAQTNGWQLGAAEMQAGGAHKADSKRAPAEADEAADESEDSAQSAGSHSHHSSGGGFGHHSVHHEGPAHDEKYTVKSGDTLMKISFEKYGSLFRWREILEANKGKLGDYSHLKKGTVLKIAGVDYVVIERDGHPYLIRLHDTLAKISGKVYGTPSQWKSIWHNNPQLIENPNKIYAGLTLYYREHPEEVSHAVRQTLGHNSHKKSNALPEKAVRAAHAVPAPAPRAVEATEPRQPAEAPASAPVQPEKPIQYELQAPGVAPSPDAAWEPTSGPAVAIPGGDVTSLGAQKN